MDDVIVEHIRQLDIERLHYLRSLRIHDIEVTQAVQFQDAAAHLTDPADRQADNSVRLVVGKPAWVRVYVTSLFGQAGVTATLEVQRRVAGVLWPTVATLSPHASSLTSVPPAATTTYAATSGNLGATLNFIVPAEEMIGRLRLIARVDAGTQHAELRIDIDVTMRQRLRLAGVMIAYNGPASMAQGAPTITIAAPTVADLQAMSGLAVRLFPVESTAVFRSAGTITLTHHLQNATFPANGCGSQWDALHQQVATARTADGNRPGWIYYGLLPNGVPMGPVGGCGGSGVGVGPIGQPRTLAHEAGHACGLMHAPGGGAPNPDPAYPAYEPYDPPNTPMGSTGEYGLDIDNGNIESPQTFRDVMSYANPPWISPYHYGKLIGVAELNPTTVGVDDPWWKDLVWQERRRWPKIPIPDPPPFDDLELPVYPPSFEHEVISLIVRVERGSVSDVLHVARVSAHTHLRDAVRTPLTARLTDADGATLASAPLQRLSTHACGCGAGCGGGGANCAGGSGADTTYLAQVFLADVAPGAALEIVDADDEVQWRREAPAEPVRVGPPRIKVGRKGGVSVAWEASAGTTDVWLRWSADGTSWTSLATGLTGTSARLDPGQVPPGEGVIQVVAHDGFFTACSESVPVDVPDPGPSVVILHPVDGSTYRADAALRLWASVVGATPQETADAVWSVDGEEVGRGIEAWATLDPGEHRIGLSLGGRRTESVHVAAVAVAQDDAQDVEDR